MRHTHARHFFAPRSTGPDPRSKTAALVPTRGASGAQSPTLSRQLPASFPLARSNKAAKLGILLRWAKVRYPLCVVIRSG